MTQEKISRYSGFAQILHWLTVVLVVAAFTLGLGGNEHWIYATAQDSQRQLHETLGISVLVVTLLRLAWRWWDIQPTPPDLPWWMSVTARWVQFVLIILLLLVPVTAIIGAWLEGHPLTFLFGVQIAPVLVPAHAIGVKVASVHRLLGDTIIWLAGLHALAGIYHHVVRGDEILLSMLPHKIGILISRKD